MATYAVGDIHGCLDELVCLIDGLPLKPDDELVFLGDYIDRGPDSKGVISFLLDLRSQARCKTVYLKGNHEDMLLSFLGLGGNHGDAFSFNGGAATLSSYGVPGHGSNAVSARAAMPDDHLDFLSTLNSYHLTGPFLCVHAGIHPGKDLTQQTEEELLWIRYEFIGRPHRLPYTVLFGHTPLKEVLFDLPYKVGLDTGLVYGNALSCLEVSEKILYQIQRGGQRVTRKTVMERWEKRSAPVSA